MKDGVMIFCNGSVRGLRQLMKLLGDYQASTGQLVSRETSFYGEIPQQVAFEPRPWDRLQTNLPSQPRGTCTGMNILLKNRIRRVDLASFLEAERCSGLETNSRLSYY